MEVSGRLYVLGLLYSWGKSSGWMGSTFGLLILENGKLTLASQ